MDPGTDTYEMLTEVGSGLVQQPSAADWSCVGEPLTAPSTSAPESIVYSFPFVDWVTDLPIPGRTINVCNKVDPQCNQPLGAPIVIPSEQRNGEITMRGGVDVYFEMRATAEYVPETLWLDGRSYGDQEGGRIQLLSQQTVVDLATSVLLPLDPSGTLGIVAVRAHDCTGAIAGGAIYEINDTSATASGVYPYTFVNGSLRGGAEASTRTVLQSDLTPWAGFINVRPGLLTVTGFLEGGRQEFGSAEIFVRPGTLSIVEIRPLDRL
jgi:hypothetical protein